MRSLVLMAIAGLLLGLSAGCSDREGKHIPTTTATPLAQPKLIGSPDGGGGAGFTSPQSK
jgi:hypothetical protein